MSTSENWKRRIERQTTQPIQVRERPAVAERRGHDGRLKIVAGAFRVTCDVDAYHHNATSVRVKAPNRPKRRMRRARRICDVLGIASTTTPQGTLDVGELSRDRIESLVDLLASY